MIRKGELRILVVGAGASGLAVSSLFSKAGHNVVTIDRSAKQHSVGLGVCLWPNTDALFRQLELTDDINRRTGIIDQWKYRDRKGRERARFLFSQYVGSPLKLIERDVLYQLLRSRTTGSPIHWATRIQDAVSINDGIAVTLSNGTTQDFDLIIAADGMLSETRRRFSVKDPVRPINTVIMGSIVSSGNLPAGTVYYSNSGNYLTSFRDENKQSPLTDGYVAFYIRRDRNRPGTPVENVDPGHLIRLAFANADSWVTRVVNEVCQSSNIYRADGRVVRPNQLGSDRIVLIGDAAHAVTPLTGMGACLSFDDAVSLVEHCGCSTRSELPQRLRQYKNQRRPYARRLLRADSISRGVMGLQSGIACDVRDAIVPWLPPEWAIHDLVRMCRN